jgi:hypothetical protein
MAHAGSAIGITGATTIITCGITITITGIITTGEMCDG